MPIAIILTALPIEYAAVRAHLTHCKEVVHRGTVYEKGIFASNGRTWTVAIAEVGAGNSGAAFEAERAISFFNPEIALFVGVAGGVKDVEIGDVVAATVAHNYERGKDEQTFSPRGDAGESSYALIQRARAEARKAEWTHRIQGDAPSTNPRAIVQEIAAGEKVVASTRSATYKFLRQEYSQCVAVEMEGRGFLKAAHASEPVKALIIRGISDLINKKRQADATGSQERASRYAAAFAFQLLDSIGVEVDVDGDAGIQPKIPLNYRRIYYEGFDFTSNESSQNSRQLDEFWLVGELKGWTGQVADGIHSLQNLSRPDAPIENCIRYYEKDAISVELGECRVSVKAKVLPPNDSHSGAGLKFRADTESNTYYAFFLNAGSTVSLTQTVNSSMSFLWSQELTGIASDSFVSLSMTGRGSEIDLSVNGLVVYTLKNADILQGSPGIIALSVGTFYFDDFAIYLPVQS
ncbi:5'-methylthioadenosine/S-adenosylhomocysteine nucleosidase [Abditibacteriota bacterium]|nr:5'-methylthioadenosine/S-adenosylhomocysteine nucleosidase [Abditibacteriota bacterium]